MTDRYHKVLTWGRGVSKIEKQLLTYFMNGPLVNLFPTKKPHVIGSTNLLVSDQ